MARLIEGGPAGTVPLVHYDKDGNRYVVGTAKAILRDGCVTIEAQLKEQIRGHEFDIKHLNISVAND